MTPFIPYSNNSEVNEKTSQAEVMQTAAGKIIKRWTRGVPFEEEARQLV